MDLVLCGAEHVGCYTGVGSLVLSPGPSYFQGAVDINAVLPTVQPAALSVLKPAQKTGFSAEQIKRNRSEISLRPSPA